ncbi:hypothetical protein H6P81_014698 [Aristolochia fimbriata]|uniref:Uncharacterized protein n=1 Tax=Aristolochia fimbriata TaxID=158543 RepID=A0AAV7E7W0_ARIFI|nr:hypothetical protein H6P81_014698 [Aristolochia fimbriata]
MTSTLPLGEMVGQLSSELSAMEAAALGHRPSCSPIHPVQGPNTTEMDFHYPIKHTKQGPNTTRVTNWKKEWQCCVEDESMRLCYAKGFSLVVDEIPILLLAVGKMSKYTDTNGELKSDAATI